MQGQATNPAPVRAPCPPPHTASFLGWLAGLIGLVAPAYRGVGQPTSSGGAVFGRSPSYRPPRSRPRPSSSCPSIDSTGHAPTSERGRENGAAVLTQPVLLDGPVTIVVGGRE